MVYDAKLRRGGFTMSTEGRKFREYVETHGSDLQTEGIEAIYFAVISSRFQSSDVTAAQQIVHGTKAKAVALVEASALRGLIDLKLRTRLLEDWSALQNIFGVTGIVTTKDVSDLESPSRGERRSR